MQTPITSNAAETCALAERLASEMKGGETVALYGDLGAGKTTFAQAFAKALGVTERVQSPTFILMHEHRLEGKDGLKFFVHADAYRGDSAQFRNIGIEEYFDRADAVTLVEWADRIEDLLPAHRIEVRIRHLGEDKREFSIARI